MAEKESWTLPAAYVLSDPSSRLKSQVETWHCLPLNLGQAKQFLPALINQHKSGVSEMHDGHIEAPQD